MYQCICLNFYFYFLPYYKIKTFSVSTLFASLDDNVFLGSTLKEIIYELEDHFYAPRKISGKHIVAASSVCPILVYANSQQLLVGFNDLVGVNGPLRQYFGLYSYNGPSPREREKDERKDRGQ